MTNLLDDDAELQVVRQHIARGESFLRELSAQFEIEKREAVLSRWNKAIVAEPTHPRMSRVREIIVQLEGELSNWRLEYLRSWPADRTKPN